MPDARVPRLLSLVARALSLACALLGLFRSVCCAGLHDVDLVGRQPVSLVSDVA